MGATALPSQVLLVCPRKSTQLSKGTSPWPGPGSVPSQENPWEGVEELLVMPFFGAT